MSINRDFIISRNILKIKFHAFIISKKLYNKLVSLLALVCTVCEAKYYYYLLEYLLYKFNRLNYCDIFCL